MRNAYADEITKLAADDPRIVLLVGDIGNKLFDSFRERFPERFFNCGVAEANMISMAAGLAMNGLRPYAYTITPFITMRCLEQIRVDVCYHEQPVVLCGVGSGLSYAANGATHHSCEDIACLRSLPGMSVVCPGDATEVRLAVRAAAKERGPVYLRLGKKGEPMVHLTPPDFRIGKVLPVRDGREVALLATGSILPVAIAAAERLEAAGISAQVVSFHTVKPLDTEYLADAFARFRVVATIEEHSILGGLGGSVAEWLADQEGPRARLVRIGTPDTFLHEAGGQTHARRLVGLTAEAIAERVRSAFGAAAPSDPILAVRS